MFRYQRLLRGFALLLFGSSGAIGNSCRLELVGHTSFVRRFDVVSSPTTARNLIASSACLLFACCCLLLLCCCLVGMKDVTPYDKGTCEIFLSECGIPLLNNSIETIGHKNSLKPHQLKLAAGAEIISFLNNFLRF